MKISIITVVRNNKDTIKDTINSVLNQTYKKIEYIIIDGASIDGTVEIVQSYGDKISKFLTEPDNGIYDAMNKGLNIASGDVIGFINADDMLNTDDCIESIVRVFKENPVEIVYGDKVYVSPKNITKQVRYWKAGEFDKEKYKKGWMTPHLSTYIKKELYDKYGGFRGDFKIAADYELMLRFIYKNNAEIKYIPKVIAKMRAGGVSNGSLVNILISNYEVYKSWKVNNLKISPLIIFQKPISKIKQILCKG